MGRVVDDSTLEVRRVLPWLHGGQIGRLSASGQQRHRLAVAGREEQRAEDERRALEVAQTLLNLGASPDLVEQQLAAWGVEPQVANHAVNVAWAAKARREGAAA